jgi:hypothetical protein
MFKLKLPTPDNSTASLSNPGPRRGQAPAVVLSY